MNSLRSGERVIVMGRQKSAWVVSPVVNATLTFCLALSTIFLYEWPDKMKKKENTWNASVLLWSRQWSAYWGPPTLAHRSVYLYASLFTHLIDFIKRKPHTRTPPSMILEFNILNWKNKTILKKNCFCLPMKQCERWGKQDFESIPGNNECITWACKPTNIMNDTTLMTSPSHIG